MKKYLTQFNVKLTKLLSLTYSHKLDNLEIIYSSNNKSLSLFKNGKSIDPTSLSFESTTLHPGIHINGPIGEEFDAYILNLRLFIQNNDQLSIKNWNEKIMRSTISEKYKNSSLELRNELNTILDSPRINIKYQGQRRVLTNRDIIELYVYGEYAHTNLEKNILFNEYKFRENQDLSFILVTKELSNILNKIRIFNQEIINYS